MIGFTEGGNSHFPNNSLNRILIVISWFKKGCLYKSFMKGLPSYGVLVYLHWEGLPLNLVRFLTGEIHNCSPDTLPDTLCCSQLGVSHLWLYTHQLSDSLTRFTHSLIVTHIQVRRWSGFHSVMYARLTCVVSLVACCATQNVSTSFRRWKYHSACYTGNV